jgi:hypothetical protein
MINEKLKDKNGKKDYCTLTCKSIYLLVMHSLGSAVAAVGVSRVRGNVTMLDVSVVGHRHACKKISKISCFHV